MTLNKFILSIILWLQMPWELRMKWFHYSGTQTQPKSLSTSTMGWPRIVFMIKPQISYDWREISLCEASKNFLSLLDSRESLSIGYKEHTIQCFIVFGWSVNTRWGYTIHRVTLTWLPFHTKNEKPLTKMMRSS